MGFLLLLQPLQTKQQLSEAEDRNKKSSDLVDPHGFRRISQTENDILVRSLAKLCYVGKWLSDYFIKRRQLEDTTSCQEIKKNFPNG